MSAQNFTCPRQMLVNIIFNSDYKNIDKKFEDLELFLIGKTNCSQNHLQDLRNSLKNFKFQFKTKWNRCSRIRSKFLSSETQWLTEKISFPKYPDPVGRPAKDFDSSSEQVKRKRTAEIRASTSTSELLYSAQMKLRAEGQKESADLIKTAVECPETIKKSLESHVPPLSALEALSLLVEANLSRKQYNIIRSYMVKILPSYKAIQKEKQSCYPEGITVNETRAEVSVQNLLDHTVKQIVKSNKEVLHRADDGKTLIMTCKFGFDGSSGHSQYHQKFVSDSSDDKFVFISCLVPLQLSDGQHIYWKNQCPSSPRYCRPLSITFEKESTTLIMKEKENIENQVNNLNEIVVPVNDKQLTIKYQMILSMIDGKLCNELSDTSSALKCYLCGSTSKHFNDIDKMLQLPIRSEHLVLGMSVLNAWIRCYECLLHVSYKLPLKTWRCPKGAVEDHEKKIRESFRIRTGLIIDKPKPGYGNTNTGNVARRFFQDSKLSSEITGVNEQLIERFHVILQCISSGFEIDIEKFKQYCIDTARLFVELYPWYYMSTTVHKLLIHGWQIISSSILPIGQLSEEALEARNKDFKNYREFLARKTSRTNTLTDVFNRMMITSDPILSNMSLKFRKTTKKAFHKDAIAMFTIVHQEESKQESSDSE